MIGIINCDTDESETTNGAILIKRLFENSEIIDLVNGETIENYDRYEGFIISGSRAGIREDIEWLNNLRDIILEINTRRIKTLAICFGMQMIANMFKGSVISNAVNEIGFQNINIVKKSLLFQGIENNLIAYNAHKDIVRRIPSGAKIIALNDYCIQGFEFENFYCIQFHPEIDSNIAQIMADRDEEEIDLRNGILAENCSLRIVSNFINIISEV